MKNQTYHGIGDQIKKHVYQTLIMGIILLTYFNGKHPLQGELMDNSVSTFYIQHNNPRLINNENVMGTIIVQNNNSAGFHVIICSDQLGKIVPIYNLVLRKTVPCADAFANHSSAFL